MAQSPGGPDQRERPTAELVKQLTEQASRLARQEVELAKRELTVKGKRAGAGAGLFGGAALLGLGLFGALTAGFVMLLATALPGWLAAFIVAVVYGLIAGILAVLGRRNVQQATPPIPEQAAQSVKEDVEWTKTKARAGRQ